MTDELELAQFKACPKCGIENDSEADTCLKCGIVFSKYISPSAPSHRPPTSSFEQQSQPRREVRSFESGVVEGGPGFLARLPIGRVVFALVILVVVAIWWLSPSYEVVGPALGEGRPVVVFLHGYGAAGDDLVPRATAISQRAPNTTFVIPPGTHRKIMGRAWVKGGTHEAMIKQVEASRALILKVVADIEGKGVATQDIYLGGFSQGSQMALDIVAGQARDRQFGGLILLSGGTPMWPDSVPPMRPDNFADHARVLISHGDSDSVVNSQMSKLVANELRKIDIPVQFVAFAGGHTISPETEDAIVEFLNNHPQ